MGRSSRKVRCSEGQAQFGSLASGLVSQRRRHFSVVSSGSERPHYCNESGYTRTRRACGNWSLGREVPIVLGGRRRCLAQLFPSSSCKQFSCPLEEQGDFLFVHIYKIKAIGKAFTCVIFRKSVRAMHELRARRRYSTCNSRFICNLQRNSQVLK